MADATVAVPGDVFHPAVILGRTTPPPRGKLKWIGGNLGLDTPVCEDVIDSDGKWLLLTLPEVLDRLDDFVGDRAGMSIQQALISNAFAAYQYRLLSESERAAFEVFVQTRLGTMPAVDVAKRLMMSV